MRGLQWAALGNATLYALIGIAIFALSFLALDKVTAFDLRKEIIEQQNVALALLLGLVSLSIAIIVAAAMH